MPHEDQPPVVGIVGKLHRLLEDREGLLRRQLSRTRRDPRQAVQRLGTLRRVAGLPRRRSSNSGTAAASGQFVSTVRAAARTSASASCLAAWIACSDLSPPRHPIARKSAARGGHVGDRGPPPAGDRRDAADRRSSRRPPRRRQSPPRRSSRGMGRTNSAARSATSCSSAGSPAPCRPRSGPFPPLAGRSSTGPPWRRRDCRAARLRINVICSSGGLPANRPAMRAVGVFVAQPAEVDPCGLAERCRSCAASPDWQARARPRPCPPVRTPGSRQAALRHPPLFRPSRAAAATAPPRRRADRRAAPPARAAAAVKKLSDFAAWASPAS